MDKPVWTLSDYYQALNKRGLLAPDAPFAGDLTRPVTLVSYDSRAVVPGSLFLCKGAHFRQSYLDQALSRGAVAYVSETPYPVEAPRILVRDIRHAMVVLGQLFYDRVTDKLISVGITGTKGKSTTAYYMRAILDDWMASMDKPACAILSSIDTYDGVVSGESHLTTPEVLELYGHFQNALDSGISHLVMEVSSQALKYGRVREMTFDVGCFTNIGTDHISPIEHPDFEDYFASKLKLFDACKVGCVNTDADHAQRVLDYAKARCPVITFGSHAGDDVSCGGMEKREDGIYFTVRSKDYNGEFSITMPGFFNVSNALAAMAMCQALGVPEAYVRSGLRRARAAGRMQVYTSRDQQVVVVVDYAHNRMSFEALYHSSKLEYPDYDRISIFGCPGNKAYLRRKDLGELSGQNCSFVYITEEDSGEEPFANIANHIAQHVTCPHVILEDRGECIRRAIQEWTGKRLILLTGKGEETRMKRGTAYVDFPSDVEFVQRYLAQYDAKAGT